MMHLKPTDLDPAIIAGMLNDGVPNSPDTRLGWTVVHVVHPHHSFVYLQAGNLRLDLGTIAAAGTSHATQQRISINTSYALPTPPGLASRRDTRWPRATLSASATHERVARTIAREILPKALRELAHEEAYRAEFQTRCNAITAAVDAVCEAWPGAVVQGTRYNRDLDQDRVVTLATPRSRLTAAVFYGGRVALTYERKAVTEEGKPVDREKLMRIASSMLYALRSAEDAEDAAAVAVAGAATEGAA